MSNKIDLSAFMNNAPIIKITISEIEAKIKIFFSMNCCEILFEHYEQAGDYRVAFAYAVFHMYEQTKIEGNPVLTATDFVSTTDANLNIILANILEQDNKVTLEYEKAKIKDVYECFYKANKAVLKNATVGISKSLYKMSKTFETLNKPLLASLNNAMSNIAMPADYLTGTASVISKLPTSAMQKINFSQFKSALTNMPQVKFPKLASILSNIPQPMFDMQALIAPLQSFSESIQHINYSWAQTLQVPLLHISKITQLLVTSVDFSLLVYRKKWSEQRETLLKYKWFYSDELPDDLVNHIHDNQDTLSIDEVDMLITEYFRQNRCAALKCIVKKWSNLPYFCCRTRIFHEALVNHSRKYFNTSVTLLTLHIEGVITDFVRTNLVNPRFHVEKAINDIKQELDKSTEVSIYEYEAFSDIIKRIEEAFKESFSHSNPDAASNESRHKVAHGHAYELESEVNSLKNFLYLNELYYLFVLLNNQS